MMACDVSPAVMFEVMADGFPQINMSIGDISAKEILSLYSPSGKSNMANFPISM